MIIKPPSNNTLSAFKATREPVKLTGGQGEVWRSGNIVLKPAIDNEETNWIANFYLTTEFDGFRLPKPVQTTEGKFVTDNWQAWEFLEGFHKKDSWDEVIEVCKLFHSAIADLPKPDYFNDREQNPWVIADKAAWGELELDHHPKIESFVDRLKGCLTPLTFTDQLIHGDFGGNVMFSDNLNPAVIDFSPYWRPAEFALGVVIADAIVWEGADFSLIDKYCNDSRSLQFLARAELRRIIELQTIYTIYGRNILDQIKAHKKLINVIYERCE
jgi:uncharacterized protein (TIGR02569 family)